MILSKLTVGLGWVLLFFSVPAVLSATTLPLSGEGEIIPLQLSVERKARFDLDAYYYRDQLYIPVAKLFSLLKIKTTSQKNKLDIFFPNPTTPLFIDFENQTVNATKGIFSFLQEDIVQIENELFMLKRHFEALLDINLDFNYRKLHLFLSSKNKLPIVSYLERKERYDRFTSSPVISTPDVILPAKHHLLKGWNADWSLNNSHSNHYKSYSYRLGLGGQLLGGDLSLRSSGNLQNGISREYLKGRWQYPIYSSSLVKQVQLGHLSHRSKVGLESQVFRGITISNAPHAPRRSFSTVSYSGILDTGWDSELYLNHRLINFSRGDQNRTYEYITPLSYGSNFIQLKTYNPNGEFVQQKQYMIYVPPEILPRGAFQYTFSAGQNTTRGVHDFGRLNFKWGVSPYLTLGGGSIVNSSINGRQLLPFIQSWSRLGDRVIATADHTWNQLTEGSFRTTFSGLQTLHLGIKKYHRASDYNKTGKSFEASLRASMPLELTDLKFSTSINTRFTRYRTDVQTLYLHNNITTQLPWHIHWRINSRLMFQDNAATALRPSQFNIENLLSKRIAQNLLLRPSLGYNYQLKQITDFQLQLRARVSHASYLDFSYRRNNFTQNHQLLLGFQIDFSFARHTSFARTNGKHGNLTQQTAGSLSLSSRRRDIRASNQRRVGRAGLVIKAFLDLNSNGSKERDEPTVEGITGDIYRPGHHLPFYQKQQIFKDLAPYNRYRIKINESALNNPLWKSTHDSYAIQVLPNMFTTVFVPVIVVGEISGSVTIEGEGNTPPIHGLEIFIYSTDDTLHETVTTYAEGEFYFVGLKPGDYKAVINPDQLQERSLAVVSGSIPFTIKPDREGDIVDGLNFKGFLNSATKGL